ncbi:hypothetical protein ACEYYB_12000 [Paracoccus sp. p4-l81]|uniref:hypothetical protein n=1 Tax=unclassified Paracoccus (in: a-proteobacteria) TaxID=2688777 RepID=UPI0035BA9D9C
MTPAQAMMAVLQDERAALLSGDLARLTEVAARSQALVGSLVTVEAADLAVLAQEARHNRQLIEAAQAGIRAGQRRLRDISACHGGGRAIGIGYDRGGRTISAAHAGRFERKS